MKDTAIDIHTKLALYDLFEVVQSRKETYEEGSYTCYLFEKGLDKILKKCGEETAEMIIAAKNHDNIELENEICDVLYHMMVLMVQNNVELDAVMENLDKRAKKIGNLKQFTQSNHNS